MDRPAEWITPDWPAPPNVGSLITTRTGGVSRSPFDSLNLGTLVGDDPAAVETNRAHLRAFVGGDPVWLRQVHGTRVMAAEAVQGVPDADGCVAGSPGKACAVLVADCLPVLLCDRNGTIVAAAHAGWRGLGSGVLEAAVASMNTAPSRLLAYLGPAIGPAAFEVGKDVLDAFLGHDPAAAACFVPKARCAEGDPKWLADLFALARRRLNSAGVDAVYGGGLCTFSDARRFFSHRRDRRTGRQAALIWLRAQSAER